jgi:uncharacterized protein YjgD (DUF1641 family)
MQEEEEKKVGLEIDKSTYNTLIELLNSTKIIQDYLNDQVIQDLSKHLGSLFKLLNIISSTDLINILERGLQDPELDKALLDSNNKVGMLGLLKALGNDDFQRGLGLMVILLTALGRAYNDINKKNE